MTTKPYVVKAMHGGYFVVADSRTWVNVSYPTDSKRRATREARTMNRAYAEDDEAQRVSVEEVFNSPRSWMKP